MEMEQQTFETRVAQVGRRLRELAPEAAAEITGERGPQSATWRRGGRWATVVQHDAPRRLELTLHPAGDVPDTLEIAPDDADVVDMIAIPVADHLKEG
jgi:hypothetical protein